LGNWGKYGWGKGFERRTVEVTKLNTIEMASVARALTMHRATCLKIRNGRREKLIERVSRKRDKGSDREERSGTIIEMRDKVMGMVMDLEKGL
jgi:hypothetical protein